MTCRVATQLKILRYLSAYLIEVVVAVEYDVLGADLHDGRDADLGDLHGGDGGPAGGAGQEEEAMYSHHHHHQHWPRLPPLPRKTDKCLDFILHDFYCVTITLYLHS